MPRARFVHGSAAGQEIQVKDQYHRIAKMGGISPFDLVADCEGPVYPAEVEHELYEVHHIKFATGHEHYYASLKSIPLVGIFNELWHGYQATQSLRHKVTELQSQNDRLKQELWREKFRNQFGEYP